MNKKPPFELTADEKKRLELIATFFSISVESSDSTLLIRSNKEGCNLDLKEPMELAHYRLFSEICDRALRWIPFKRTVSAKDSLFLLSDAKLKRIGELFDRWHSMGCPK